MSLCTETKVMSAILHEAAEVEDGVEVDGCDGACSIGGWVG